MYVCMWFTYRYYNALSTLSLRLDEQRPNLNLLPNNPIQSTQLTCDQLKELIYSRIDTSSQKDAAICTYNRLKEIKMNMNQRDSSRDTPVTPRDIPGIPW